jgi:RsiW-degrading membrane proteinase PrsW (M82 family)
LLLVIIGASVNPNSSVISGSQYFSSLLTLAAFIIAGIAGGGFSLYHSIRGILHKGSASFKLPWFWIFFIVYLFVLGIGYALLANGREVVIPVLTIFLIILAAIFPALTLLALAVRRLRFPDWTTTWRRFTLALTSGATLGVGLALVIEIALLFLVVQGPGAAQARECIGNPDLPFCGTFTAFNIIFLIVAIIGPIVEETVKPLAVVLYIGRLRSPSEAFLLGMASGIGFALVETVGYIGSGYHDWLAVAIERTGAGLLHGVGAGMVTLGWYYLTHAEKHRFLKALGFWSYAVFQHFVWNATAVLGLLPGPVGTTLNSWNLNVGFVTLPFIEILNIIEAILILLFFFYITGRLRKKKPSPPTSDTPGRVPGRETQVAVRV